MSKFIAGRIKKANEASIDAGREKYMAYFVSTPIWAQFKSEVDMILIKDGCEDCIVYIK